MHGTQTCYCHRHSQYLREAGTHKGEDGVQEAVVARADGILRIRVVFDYLSHVASRNHLLPSAPPRHPDRSGEGSRAARDLRALSPCHQPANLCQHEIEVVEFRTLKDRSFAQASAAAVSSFGRRRIPFVLHWFASTCKVKLFNLSDPTSLLMQVQCTP